MPCPNGFACCLFNSGFLLIRKNRTVDADVVHLKLSNVHAFWFVALNMGNPCGVMV